jgi:hypothetical protein
MKKLKARAKALIFEKMDITMEHKISIFFDPRFRQMKMLTVADGKVLLNKIGSLVQSLFTSNGRQLK